MPKGIYVRRKGLGFWKRSDAFKKNLSWKMRGNRNAVGKCTNEKHCLWKGDKVGLEALHAWVRRRLKMPKRCPDCSKRRKLDLANISQKYKRDLADWEWLCRKCHMTKDGRIGRRDKSGKFTSIEKCSFKEAKKIIESMI